MKRYALCYTECCEDTLYLESSKIYKGFFANSIIATAKEYKDRYFEEGHYKEKSFIEFLDEECADYEAFSDTYIFEIDLGNFKVDTIFYDFYVEDFYTLDEMYSLCQDDIYVYWSGSQYEYVPVYVEEEVEELSYEVINAPNKPHTYTKCLIKHMDGKEEEIYVKISVYPKDLPILINKPV